MQHKQLHIVYLSFYGLPGRATHNIQIMNMCSSFAKIPGLKVTLIAPHQSNFGASDVKTGLWEFYGLKENFKILFTPDKFNLRNKTSLLKWYYRAIGTFLYTLNFIRKQKEEFIIYSRATKLSGIFNLFSSVHRLKNYQGYFCELHTLYRDIKHIKRYKGLIVISSSLKKDILNNYPAVKEERILTAHDGLNLNGGFSGFSIDHLRKKLKLPGDKKIITYTGRLIHGKGADKLINAFSAFGNRDDLLLLLVGKVYGDHYYELVKELSIKNIIFKGFVPPSEVKEYLYCSDILVMPSTEDLAYGKYTSPLKLFEYMGSGKPLIASSLESISEIIEHRKNGLLYNPSNINELTEAINYLLNNKEHSLRMAEQAFKDSKKYTWDKRAQLISDFIIGKTEIN